MPIPEEPDESPFTAIEEIATIGLLIDPAKRSRAPIKPLHRYNPLKDMKVSFISPILLGNYGTYNLGGR